MSSSPDGKLYKLIKENIICPKYMNVIKVQSLLILNFWQKIAISQMKMVLQKSL